MNPSFEDFVNLQMGSTSDSESLRILKGCLNYRGLVCGCTVFIFNNAVQRGNDYDLPDNGDNTGPTEGRTWLVGYW